jgi:GNAT superfamily N-acetyltransferase
MSDDALIFRRPVEADHARIIAVVDDWWGGQKVRAFLPRRFWFQHFTGRSWIAETGDGRLAGFLVGFISPDHPDEAVIHLVGTNPNRRRRGLGRELYRRFAEDVRADGIHRIQAITWPGNRISVAFPVALGFAPDDGPGTQRLYGTASYPDYDGEGEDRTVFTRGS